jgi:hypothetical protein
MAQISDQSIVPFGKYEVQPMEVLLADAKYTRWLLAQPGFQVRN